MRYSAEHSRYLVVFFIHIRKLNVLKSIIYRVVKLRKLHKFFEFQIFHLYTEVRIVTVDGCSED
jgi:hypothetical protein